MGLFLVRLVEKAKSLIKARLEHKQTNEFSLAWLYFLRAKGYSVRMTLIFLCFYMSVAQSILPIKLLQSGVLIAPLRGNYMLDPGSAVGCASLVRDDGGRKLRLLRIFAVKFLSR